MVKREGGDGRELGDRSGRKDGGLEEERRPESVVACARASVTAFERELNGGGGERAAEKQRKTACRREKRNRYLFYVYASTADATSRRGCALGVLSRRGV